MWNVIRRATLIGLGVVVAIVVAELGVRLAGPRLASPAARLPLDIPPAMVDRFATGQLRLKLDFDLGWRPTPGYDGVDPGRAGVRYRHNRDGLRADRDSTATLRAGLRRMSAYGDSFTYCNEVNFEDCWTHRLERLLPSTEVLNFGVSGYGPDQAWLRYQRGGASWQPCAVLIGHMPENINRVVNRFRPFYAPETSSSVPEASLSMPKPRFVMDGDRPKLLPIPTRDVRDLEDPGWVEANLGPYDAWYFPGTLVANPLDRLQSVRLVRTAVYRKESEALFQRTLRYLPGTEAFDVLTAVMTDFAGGVRAAGATPVVLVLPDLSAILAQRDKEPKRHAALLEALAQRGIATIDLTNALGRAARRSAPPGLTEPGGHYSPRGNAVVARALAERLPRLTSATCGAG